MSRKGEGMEHIKIVNWRAEDSSRLKELFQHVDRTYLSNRIPESYTHENAVSWLNMVERQEGGSGIFRAITFNKEYVGNISVEKKSDVYHKDAEIGYFIVRDQYSRGITTEAVRQICEIAFEQLDVIRITGYVYSPNIASKRVLEKNGFVREGTMKNAVEKNGALYDLCIYGKYR